MKKGMSKVMQDLNIFCEEEGVSDDVIFEYFWCIDFLSSKPIVVSMESMCQSISQKELTNLN